MIKILKTNNSNAVHDQPVSPTLEQLYEWIECEFIEVVKVCVDERHEQLIIDAEGRLKGKPYNIYATRLYLENVRLHNTDLFLKATLDPDANIVGTAVLLTDNHKLT